MVFQSAVLSLVYYLRTHTTDLIAISECLPVNNKNCLIVSVASCLP